MRFAPDPIAFLLPYGHQRATHSAYRTSKRENLLGRALFEHHDELARTVPTVPYRSRTVPPSPTYHYAQRAGAGHLILRLPFGDTW